MAKTLKRPPARGFTPTQLAGRAISSKNQELIKAAIDKLVEAAESLKVVLGEAGVLGEDEDSEEGTQAARSLDTQVEASELVEASEFTDYIDRSNWYQRLDNILWSFSWFFQYAVCDGSNTEEINQLIADLSLYLQELATSYPVVSASIAQLAAAKPGRSSDGKDIYHISCDFDLIEAGSGVGNRYPIEGKLFTVDQLSEGIPAKGPGKKLYIPRAVAEEAINQCVGLPLDAADSLDHHANDQIVGVTLGATLKQDNGFWVKANLFPFNQPEKVAKIRANKEKLGFSINAYLPGHDEEINGEVAHVADRLILLGANILYKEDATFQQTELVASVKKAAKERPNSYSQHSISSNFAQVARHLIAANAKPESIPATQPLAQPLTENTGDELVNEELKKQLEMISAAITQLSETVQPLASSVAVLVEERNTRINQEKEQEAAQAARQQLQDMQALMRQTARETFASIMNPSGQPYRQSSGVVSASEKNSIQDQIVQIVQLEARLAEASRSNDPTMMARRIQLRDQLHNLKAQLPAEIA